MLHFLYLFMGGGILKCILFPTVVAWDWRDQGRIRESERDLWKRREEEVFNLAEIA